MLSDDELAELYERIENDEELEFEFEDQVYNDFEEMIDLAEMEKDNYIQDLLEEMYELEEIQDLNQDFYDDEYYDMQAEIEMLYAKIEEDESRY